MSNGDTVNYLNLRIKALEAELERVQKENVKLQKQILSSNNLSQVSTKL